MVAQGLLLVCRSSGGELLHHSQGARHGEERATNSSSSVQTAADPLSLGANPFHGCSQGEWTTKCSKGGASAASQALPTEGKKEEGLCSVQ